MCKLFFEVDETPISTYSVVFNVDGNIYMNKVIPRQEAVHMVKKMGSGFEEKQLSNYYVSLEPIQARNIKDFREERIFGFINERISGWLVQYDPTPFANWYHKCWYYFVVNEYCFEKTESKCGLCDCIKMERVQ